MARDVVRRWPFGLAIAVLIGWISAPRTGAQDVQFPVMPPDRVDAFEQAAAQHLDYLPGQVVIKFKDGTTKTGQQRALMALRSKPDLKALKWSGGIAMLADASQPDAHVLAQQLSEQPEVEYAQPDYLSRPQATFTPNDPDFSARQNWNFSAADIPRAWSLEPTPGGSATIVVAVLDTGVTVVPAQNMQVKTFNGSTIVSTTVPIAPSPDLDLARLVKPVDFIVSLAQPGSTVVDTQSHGTHVASTIAESTNNGLTLAGIAFNARIMPIKVCASYWDVQFAQSAAGIPGFAPQNAGGCPDSAIAAGIRYAADNGASVLNISIVGPSGSQVVLDALTYAVGKGVFISISMGNDFDTDNHESFPAGFAPQLNGVVSVAATGPGNTHASYSTTGPQCELAAPGGDVSFAGSVGAVYQTTLRQSDISSLLLLPRFDRYDEVGFEGTSMAAPHVSGIAALVRSEHPSFSPAEVESLLEKTALDLGAAGKDNTFGFGLVQAGAALRGFGIAR